ncbi:restriction endonuclease subunit S [Helicobacter bizzozeronii]|uniref:restriction endonuclease subunit S n=1 Tax=Helicobacter bizzozeronii TaxID=56877 RepID=UPI0013157C77|nr:restriction endonuclease subunit S [Helicobacter bizzozeronii]
MPHSLAQNYPHLEVSVLKLSAAWQDNPTKRLDAEYFKREWVENGEKVQSPYTIGDFVSPKIANIKSFKLNKNFHYLQISDIDLSNGLTYSTMKIDFKQIPDRATYVLQKNDVCVSLVRPNRNAVALITQTKRLVGTSGFCVLRVASQELIPEFLYVFCKTNFFITQMVRANTASMYPAILDRDVLNCKIPLLPLDFQEHIAHLVQNAHYALEQSKSLYKEAQELLEQELGTLPSAPLKEHSIKTLKESFLSTGRLDAEFYQHRYAQIENLIKNYKGGWGVVRNFFIQNKKDYEGYPLEYPNYFYIEIGDVAVNSGTISYHSLKREELPDNAKILAKQGDLLVSKVRPNRGAVAIIDHQAPNLIVSGAFVVLREMGDYHKETLQALLRLPLYKEYLLKWNTGTSYPVIKDEDILNLPIPQIPAPTQEQIATLLQESLQHRQEAKTLLVRARTEVEGALSRERERERERSLKLKYHLKRARHLARLAQWLLLETLLLNQKTHSIKTLKQSLGATGRLDAEFYQEKYEHNEAFLKARPHARLKELVEIKKSMEPGSGAYKDRGVPFVRVSNLSPFGISPTEVFLSPSAELEPLYPQKEEVLLSKDGSLGIAYCVPHNLEVVLSGAILRLEIKDTSRINPHYLTLCLNYKTTQLQAQRDSIGSIIAHWNMEQIQNLLIPLVSSHIQERIARTLQESFKHRQEAEQLLEKAKLEVEGFLDF